MHDQNHFMYTGAHGIDGDDVPFLIPAVHVYQPRNQQLTPVKALVFASGHYGSNYSSKNHN